MTDINRVLYDGNTGQNSRAPKTTTSSPPLTVSGQVSLRATPVFTPHRVVVATDAATVATNDWGCPDYIIDGTSAFDAASTIPIQFLSPQTHGLWLELTAARTWTLPNATSFVTFLQQKYESVVAGQSYDIPFNCAPVGGGAGVPFGVTFGTAAGSLTLRGGGRALTSGFLRVIIGTTIPGSFSATVYVWGN